MKTWQAYLVYGACKHMLYIHTWSILQGSILYWHKIYVFVCTLYGKMYVLKKYVYVYPIQVGPRDVASGTCVVSRRDCPGKEGKQMGVPLSGEGLLTVVNETLEDIQMQLLREAIAFRDSNIVDVDSYEGLKVRVRGGCVWRVCEVWVGGV